jgi:hypothetical protein
MANAIAPGREQSWEDRLREAAYTSPSNRRILFQYEDLSREFDLRTAAFDFAGLNDSYVQQNGNGSRRYPLRCFFTGRDCDLLATAFEAALLEHGRGKLEHPLYGTFDVVPFGTVTRRDDLKTSANQSIVEVVFWTTLKTVYPLAIVAPQSEILAAIESFNFAAAQQFANSTDLRGALNQANAKAGIKKFLDDTSGALSKVAGAVASVNSAFRDAQAVVNQGMDVLIGQPLQIALAISNLITAPARALTGIEDRLDAYGALADKIFGSPQGNPSSATSTGSALRRRRQRIMNDWRIADHWYMATVGATVTAITATPISDDPSGDVRTSLFRSRGDRSSPGAQFVTKPQALRAAEDVIGKFDTLIEWRDAGFAELDAMGGVSTFQVDTGEAIAALQEAVGLAVGFLVETSFSLVPEKRIVLDRNRTILDLAGELYKATDNDTLDFLINTNELTGSKILELERGDTILYYP